MLQSGEFPKHGGYRAAGKASGDAAVVELIFFTKWGGFLRETLTINRSFPPTIMDIKEENLVEYDCGVAF